MFITRTTATADHTTAPESLNETAAHYLAHSFRTPRGLINGRGGQPWAVISNKAPIGYSLVDRPDISGRLVRRPGAGFLLLASVHARRHALGYIHA